MKDETQNQSAGGGHWAEVPLASVLDKVNTGFATGKRDPKGIVQLRMNNVSTLGQFDWSVLTRVPESEVGGGSYLEPGDVLFNNTNSTELVGKSALFQGHTEPVVYSNHFTRLRTKKEKLLPEYLALWLQKQWQNRVFADICNQWIGQSAVQPNKLTSLLIPLPPLSEQQQIAESLQTQLAVLEETRAAAEAQLATLRLLPAALLRTAFSVQHDPQPPRNPPATPPQPPRNPPATH
jgi:type I restriction enzyme, S subunit